MHQKLQLTVINQGCALEFGITTLQSVVEMANGKLVRLENDPFLITSCLNFQ